MKLIFFMVLLGLITLNGCLKKEPIESRFLLEHKSQLNGILLEKYRGYIKNEASINIRGDAFFDCLLYIGDLWREDKIQLSSELILQMFGEPDYEINRKGLKIAYMYKFMEPDKSYCKLVLLIQNGGINGVLFNTYSRHEDFSKSLNKSIWTEFKAEKINRNGELIKEYLTHATKTDENKISFWPNGKKDLNMK